MELLSITDACYYFSNPTNIGYIKGGETGLLIDAGLDASTAKKALRELDAREWPVTHLFITHAHSDHYGGAHEIQRRKTVTTFAPEIEADVLRYPKWESLYLFHGNEPPEVMRNKFIEGKKIQVDKTCHEGVQQFGDLSVELVALPGHSDNQMGLIFEGILYAADSYMALEVLQKHRLPFFIDYKRLLESQEKLLSLPKNTKGAVPGHGFYEENFKQTVEENIAFHQQMLESVLTILRQDKLLPASGDSIVKVVCDACGVQLKDVSMWSLFRTAVMGYVMEGVRSGVLEMVVDNNIRLFRSRISGA